MKKDILHHDLFGEELKKDDIVIAAQGVRGQLKICKIVAITKKMVKVEEISFTKYKRTFLRYPKFLIKIESDRAAEYILALG